MRKTFESSSRSLITYDRVKKMTEMISGPKINPFHIERLQLHICADFCNNKKSEAHVSEKVFPAVIDPCLKLLDNFSSLKMQ